MSGMCCVGIFFCKQKAAYEMRISEWSSGVCSSDLGAAGEDVDEGRRSDGRGAGSEGRSGSEQAQAFGQSHGGSPFRFYWLTQHVDDRRCRVRRSEARRVGKECVMA